MRKLWIALTYLVFFLLIAAPLGKMAIGAFSEGFGGFWNALTRPEALHALMMTGLVVIVVTLLNTLFGIMMALYLVRANWIGKRLKGLLNSIVDLPYAVSPVIGGLMIVLLLGPDSTLGAIFEGIGLKIVYAIPGMIIATLFVTFPLMVREVMPCFRRLVHSRRKRLRHWALVAGLFLEGNLAFDSLGGCVWCHSYGGTFTWRVRRGARSFGEHYEQNSDGDNFSLSGC